MLQGQDWEHAKKHARIVAKAWSDAAFKERLLAEPWSVLKEHGFEVSAGVEVKVIEQASEGVVYDGKAMLFAMPARPDGEFGDEDLSVETARGDAGGRCHGSGGCCNSACIGPMRPPRLDALARAK
jgi:hypothetical protein